MLLTLGKNTCIKSKLNYGTEIRVVTAELGQMKLESTIKYMHADMLYSIKAFPFPESLSGWVILVTDIIINTIITVQNRPCQL